MYKDVVKGVARSTSIVMLQYVVTWGASFAAMMFIPRYLGPVEYGRLYLGLSIVSLFRVFVEYGGNYLVAKEVSRNPENTAQIVVDAVAFRLILAMLAFGGVLVTAWEGGYPAETNLILAITGLGLFGHGAVATLHAMLQGREHLEYSSAGSLANSLFGNLFSVIVVLVWRSTWMIAAIGVAASALQLAVMYAYARRFIPVLPRVRWNDAWRQVRDGVPYFFFAVFSTIYYRIDTVMLSKMTPEAVVGWYGAAYKLFEAMNFFPFIFSTVVYPVLSRLWQKEEALHRRTAQKSLEFMLLLGIPLSIGLIVFARLPVEILYGMEGYAPAVVLFQILAGGIVFLFVDMILGTLLLASDRQRSQSYLALAAIPVNIGLNLLMIPWYQEKTGNGAIGAAIATGVTEIFLMVAMIRLMPKGVMKGFRLSVVYKGIAAGGVMTAAVWSLSRAGAPAAASVIAAVCVYCSMIMLLRTLEPAEIKAVRMVLTPNGIRSVFRAMLHGRDESGKSSS